MSNKRRFVVRAVIEEEVWDEVTEDYEPVGELGEPALIALFDTPQEALKCQDALCLPSQAS